ncbi:potassium transporter TrkA [Campylobacter sp. RKI_CA19_01128]|uniref:COG3400 family protein n=1 Tax=unclassified Campylobacter TaxID=2593542 RepID=UPI0021E6E24A|nr:MULTISPECIES: TrkA C-terminal domain-containing protein [unclassified Campylobacter]HEC1753091.1 potassium transporter TrkA [Campylobacter lari]MCV3337249.1 potassium transporter TrkA [Campylobacter sp. RKI_CA19_01121]MCV3349622.1 potassium transporter TrkA [Campylobacter sp. RKI_CA19_01127]MCV3355581.1 potassium transporter TrkA [Campylobacter sp. RKI_CA19_01128]MCV3387248.1 potassium transporter TrkA [Campylobacter sp. IFREMER_LSEM_CL2256]
MNKILLLADGIFAKDFLRKIHSNKTFKESLSVVYYNDESVDLDLENEQISFYKFDPTSLVKLENLLKEEFHQAIIYMQEEADMLACYKNLRKLHPRLNIVIMDLWNSQIDDNFCEVINIYDTLSTRLTGCLDNMPSMAQFIGLGQGEIMEVKIPAGSSFAYRHISSISQKRFKIVMVYRNNEFILARPGLILMPNDSILIVGDPKVLQSVFTNVKTSLGRFPSPFGDNILCIIDMKKMSEFAIEKLIFASLLLHVRINSKKLYFKVINPTLTPMYYKLKALHKNSTEVIFDFESTNVKNIKPFVENTSIGLLVVEDYLFEKEKSFLFTLKIPVLKAGKGDFADLKSSVVLSSNFEDVEGIASIMLDLNKQIQLGLALYYYDLKLNKAEIFEYHQYFESLSKLHDEKLLLIEEKEHNPINKFSYKQNVLHFVPFNEKILGSNFNKILKTDLNTIYYKMSKNYQLFIPSL